jgi:exonuclease III
MYMRYGTWNVRSLYRAGSPKPAASELGKDNFDVVAVQEVRRVNGGSEPEENYTFFYDNRDANHHLQTLFLHKGIISTVKGGIYW